MRRSAYYRELLVALLVAALCCAATATISALLAEVAAGASPPASPHCRVVNEQSGSNSLGSGTLVDVARDSQRGLVLTCAHLFSEGAGRIRVTFPGGLTHGALLVGIDRQADLAALEIARPQAASAEVSFQLDRGAQFTACGFGPVGNLRCISGAFAGQATGAGQTSVKTTGAVRSGDSGGGLFDQRGRLVGVVWGQAGGVTYSSTGGPLRTFLSRFLGNRIGGATSPSSSATPYCPTGVCPLVPHGIDDSIGVAPPLPESPTTPVAPPSSPGCECPQRPALGDGLALGRSDGVRGVGVAGPAALAIAVAAVLGGWLLGRWNRRRTGNAGAKEAAAEAANSFRDATTTVDVQQPIERDDRESQQLLRLSQLEGRDPLQDAVAGRLALDRLDEIADGGSDPQHKNWADGLRRELRERFNDIAPTKFVFGGGAGS